MRLRGVNYDVGRVLDGQNWRPAFDPAEAGRELEIIRDDLHCNAVKICGEDIGRLISTAADAAALGLEVWLSPELWDQTAEDTLGYIATAAREAEELRREWPGRVTLSVGTELTLFMRGIVEGDTFHERLAHPALWKILRSGAHNAPLNEFLARAAGTAREVFEGDITYASLAGEKVDWSNFDVVSVDLYRDAGNRDWFTRWLRSFFAPGKPVVITESGCCTYRGAAAAGGRGWEIVDFSELPPRLNGEYIRDETEQAREVADLIATFAEAGAAGTFVFTFVAPLNPYCDDPKFDLDMANYSLVRSYGNRLGELAVTLPGIPWDDSLMGTTYPDMPWEPKESFGAVAGAYAALAVSGTRPGTS
ncbi:MAG: hypothetical protein JO345_23400 [Streptosporangiaceae bacterium]|nr:hypothetical protein [Streptosporangiaceae bacterium]